MRDGTDYSQLASPDGARLLGATTGGSDAPFRQIVLNWLEELKRLAPARRGFDPCESNSLTVDESDRGRAAAAQGAPANESTLAPYRARGLPSIPMLCVSLVAPLPSRFMTKISMSRPVLGRDDMK